MLEQVDEHRGAGGDAVRVHRRPQLVGRPPDNYGTFSRFESVLVNDGVPATGRRVHLDLITSAVHLDECGRRDTRGYDVLACEQALELRRMHVEKFAPRAGTELGHGIRERVGVEPPSRSSGVVFGTQPLYRPVGGEKQHGPGHSCRQRSARSALLPPPAFDVAPGKPPRIAALDRLELAGRRHQSHRAVLDAQKFRGLSHADGVGYIHGRNTTANGRVSSSQRIDT